MVNYGRPNRLGFLMLGAFLLSKVHHGNCHFHSINKKIMEDHMVSIIKGGNLENNVLNEFGSLLPKVFLLKWCALFELIHN